jgi:DNA primase large subunit
VLTERDLAKYPFLAEAAEYIRALSLKIEDLESPDFKSVVDRAEGRVEEAILYALVDVQPRYEIEIPSFPIAVMMVAAAGDARLKRRYALAEAKRAYNFIQEENEAKIMGIASNFHWRLKRLEGAGPYDFILFFTDFLKNTTIFHEEEWKLVNRFVSGGEVYLAKHDVARLLQEEVQRHIEERLDLEVGSIPETIMVRVERLKQLFLERRGSAHFEETPKGVVMAAFPPCIRALYEAVASGRRVSHLGRFALTSFLLNIEMSVDEIVDLFRASSDFNERIARYQVEHIAGRKGSRTKYIPPRCNTLRTHGVCPAMEETCRQVRHPLAYYRRRLRAMRKPAPTEESEKETGKES